MPPVPNGFVADVNATLMQQVFDVPERKRKPDVEHHRQADDLRAVVSDGCEPVSVCQKNRDPMLNKVDATRRERRRGLA